MRSISNNNIDNANNVCWLVQCHWKPFEQYGMDLLRFCGFQWYGMDLWGFCDWSLRGLAGTVKTNDWNSGPTTTVWWIWGSQRTFHHHLHILIDHHLLKKILLMGPYFFPFVYWQAWEPFFLLSCDCVFYWVYMDSLWILQVVSTGWLVFCACMVCFCICDMGFWFLMLAFCHLQIVQFGDRVILGDPIEKWVRALKSNSPWNHALQCDWLTSFQCHSILQIGMMAFSLRF